MQILIDRALMDQCNGRSWQRLLGFNALGNVTKLFRVFLNNSKRNH